MWKFCFPINNKFTNSDAYNRTKNDFYYWWKNDGLDDEAWRKLIFTTEKEIKIKMTKFYWKLSLLVMKKRTLRLLPIVLTL